MVAFGLAERTIRPVVPILLMATLGCAEPSAPAAVVLQSAPFVSVSVESRLLPVIIRDDGTETVRLVYDRVSFGDDAQAFRRAVFQVTPKAGGSATYAFSETFEPYTVSGTAVSIRLSTICLATIPCPDFETGSIQNGELTLSSRYTGFRTVKYVRAPILPD